MPPTHVLRRLTPRQVDQLPVGMKVRWARAQKGYSHDTLAAKAQTTRSHLIKIEKGLHQPGRELLSRIAGATEHGLEFFTGDEDDEEEAALARELMTVLRRLLVQIPLEAI